MREELRRLRDLAANRHPSELDAKRFADQAELVWERLPLGDTSVNRWHAIVRYARWNGKLDKLLNDLEEEHKKDEDMMGAITNARTAPPDGPVSWDVITETFMVLLPIILPIVRWTAAAAAVVVLALIGPRLLELIARWNDRNGSRLDPQPSSLPVQPSATPPTPSTASPPPPSPTEFKVELTFTPPGKPSSDCPISEANVELAWEASDTRKGHTGTAEVSDACTAEIDKIPISHREHKPSMKLTGQTNGYRVKDPTPELQFQGGPVKIAICNPAHKRCRAKDVSARVPCGCE